MSTTFTFVSLFFIIRFPDKDKTGQLLGSFGETFPRPGRTLTSTFGFIF